MYMCVCILCVCKHVYTDVCLYVHAGVCVHVCMCVYMLVCLFVCVCRLEVKLECDSSDTIYLLF